MAQRKWDMRTILRILHPAASALAATGQAIEEGVLAWEHRKEAPLRDEHVHRAMTHLKEAQHHVEEVIDEVRKDL